MVATADRGTINMKHIKRDFGSKTCAGPPEMMGSNVKIHFFRTWSCCISNSRESRMQQHGRKYFGREPPPTPSNPGGQNYF